MNSNTTETADREGAAAWSATAPAATPVGRGPLGWFLALLGWTTILCFYDLAGGARFEPIDCWVAQTAREMRAAGDWLVPRFSGEVRMQKSPGPYWAVMLTSLARGTPIDEVSARIPSALAAVVLVATIFWLTRRIAGDRAAIFAGFATSGSVLILWWSHRAASDFGLTALTTLALAALWIGSEREPPGPRRIGLWLLGYFAAGLGMLYKMPMPLVVVGLPALAYVLVRNRWSVLASRWHLLGLGLFLLPWLPWVIGVSLVEDTALAKWKVEFLDRFTGDLPNVAGQQSWKFLLTYLGPPLLYCLPFTFSLPGAVVRAFRRQAGVDRNGALFMLIWFASLFIFFTASAGKEWRYFLPALPPLFVLLGIELSAVFDPNRSATPGRDRVMALAVWFLVPAGLFAGGLAGLHRWWELRGRSELPEHTWGDVWPAYAVTAAILAAGIGLAAWLHLRRREHAAFAAVVATMWAMWGWTWPRLMPLVSSQQAFIDFAQQVRERLPAEPPGPVLHVGSQDSRIIWYGDFRFRRLIDQLKLLEEQGYRRSLEYEVRRYGDEMVRRLAGAEPVLFVASLYDYATFLQRAPGELARTGRSMPPVRLWVQTRRGHFGQHFVLFGNRPPPFPEPELRVPDKLRAKLAGASRSPADTRPAPTRPASRPGTGG